MYIMCFNGIHNLEICIEQNVETGSYNLLSVEKQIQPFGFFVNLEKSIFCDLQLFSKTLYNCEYSKFKFHFLTQGPPLENDTIW